MAKFLIALFFVLLSGCAYAQDKKVIETIAYEASGEGIEGMQAVANVIKTRSIKRNMSPYAVVTEKYQFSCWKEGVPTQTRTLTAIELRQAKEAWENATVWDYDHYAYHTIDNYWTKKAVDKKRIGNHVFYNLGD